MKAVARGTRRLADRAPRPLLSLLHVDAPPDRPPPPPSPLPLDEQSCLVCPGRGIFFFWQAGAVSALHVEGYDLSRVRVSGASAGAITATLAATEADFDEATEVAFEMAREAGVLTRSVGLMGVWGPMIERWLSRSFRRIQFLRQTNGYLSS